MAGPIHYEVYVRKSAPSSWTLLIATEDRKHAIETAEEQPGPSRHRLARDQGDAGPRDDGVQLLDNPDAGRAGGAKEEGRRQGGPAGLQQSGRTLLALCPRPDRPGAGGLAETRGRDRLRTAASPGCGRTAGGGGGRASARHPEGRGPGKPGDGPGGARRRAPLSEAGRAGDGAAAQGRARRRLSVAGGPLHRRSGPSAGGRTRPRLRHGRRRRRRAKEFARRPHAAGRLDGPDGRRARRRPAARPGRGGGRADRCRNAGGANQSDRSARTVAGPGLPIWRPSSAWSRRPRWIRFYAWTRVWR